LFLGLSSQN